MIEEKNVAIFDTPEALETALQERQTTEPTENQGEKVAATTETKTDKSKQDFNEAEYLRSNFGEGFDSIEKVKGRLATPPIDEKVKKYLSDAEFLSKNPQAYNLAKIAAENPGRVDAYIKAMKYDVSSMTPFDKIVAKQVMETHGVSEADIRLALKAEYGLFDEDDDGFTNLTSVEKAQARIRMARDEKSAEDYLLNFQKEAMLPEPQKKLAEDDAKKAERIETVRASWKPEIDKMAGDITFGNKQNFDYHGEKIPVDFKFAVSDEDKKLYSQIAEDLVKSGTFENNAQNQALIKQMTNALFLETNFSKIASAVGTSVLTSFHEITGHKFYGVPPKAGTTVDNTQTTEKREGMAKTELRASDF